MQFAPVGAGCFFIAGDDLVTAEAEIVTIFVTKAPKCTKWCRICGFSSPFRHHALIARKFADTNGIYGGCVR